MFAPVQICKAGLARMRKIWLSRHGESMYNTLARLGGDSTLSPRGEVYAYKLPDVLVDRVPLVRSFCRQLFKVNHFEEEKES